MYLPTHLSLKALIGNPGNMFHALGGDRKGQYAIGIIKGLIFVWTRITPLTQPSPPSLGERVGVRGSELSILFRDD
jgi:hypothetical protein